MPDASTQRVEVTDPTHPLFGKSFEVLSVSRGSLATATLLVRYRHGITLRIPAQATNLFTGAGRSIRSKLTADAAQALVGLVKEYAPCPSLPRKSGATSRRTSNKKSSKS